MPSAFDTNKILSYSLTVTNPAMVHRAWSAPKFRTDLSAICEVCTTTLMHPTLPNRFNVQEYFRNQETTPADLHPFCGVTSFSILAPSSDIRLVSFNYASPDHVPSSQQPWLNSVLQLHLLCGSRSLATKQRFMTVKRNETRHICRFRPVTTVICFSPSRRIFIMWYIFQNSKFWIASPTLGYHLFLNKCIVLESFTNISFYYCF